MDRPNDQCEWSLAAGTAGFARPPTARRTGSGGWLPRLRRTESARPRRQDIRPRRGRLL